MHVSIRQTTEGPKQAAGLASKRSTIYVALGDVRVTKTVQALQVKVLESFIDQKDFSQFEGVGNMPAKW